MTFVSQWDRERPIAAQDIVLFYRDNTAGFDTENNRFISWRDIEVFFSHDSPDTVFLGSFGKQNIFLLRNWDSRTDQLLPFLVDTRSTISLLSIPQLEVLSAGKKTQHWLENHRFCGRCGAPLELKPHDRVLSCPECQTGYYPKISPAVITAVMKGDEILLGHNKRFPEGLYSLIAGFVDPGESAETTVAREVLEETGIEVQNIRYYGSQPWPFPDSLMLGFIAEYRAGELRPDRQEILDARWFSLDNLPILPMRGSIARRMLEGIFPDLTKQ